MSELENGFRIGDVAEMVRRHLAVVVGAAVIGAIVGYLAFAAEPTIYSATARVQVRPIQLNEFDDGSRPAVVDIATEMDLVRSDAVAERVRDELGLEGDNRAILQRIAVATEVDSLVLKIDFAGDDAAQAQAGANAVAQGYLQQRKDGAATSVTTATARLDADIQAASEAAAEADVEAEGLPEGSPERAAARSRAQAAASRRDALIEQRTELGAFDPESVGSLVRAASLPSATTSKMAMGKGAGVFGIFVLAGLAAAWLLDRRDGLGGGRRRLEQLVPGANLRVMPGAEGTNATPAEIDTAIDRLAVELAAGSVPGKATSVLVIGAGNEPPVALAEELASSLTFAGIPALFILAGSTERELRGAHTVASFADLADRASLVGPAGLPARAGEPAIAAGPLVSWLRPQGSPEAAGLMRRAVVDTVIARAARERFEAVIFVAPSPTRSAAGAALGQWVTKTALIVGPDERSQAEAAATALGEADVRVTEVVWT